MRSLTVKLTLAFLLVGLAGAISVALLISWGTRSAFDRFLSDHDRSVLVEALGGYYVAEGGWDGVGRMLSRTRPLDFYSRGIALADAGGAVVLPKGPYGPGEAVPAATLAAATPVQAGGQTVGYVIFLTPEDRRRSDEPPPPDIIFLQQVSWAATASALIAALIALLLGLLLARTLTRPLRELTAATEAMARGELGQQVAVRSRDEVGALAQSFNQMSADLARASQLRQQMTADLAHDLRTPLSILRGYTEGLQDGRLAGAPPIYTVMHGEVEHLQHMVEDLRVLSLADAGELPLNRRAVDPAALLERAGLAHIVQAEQQGVALRVEAPEGLPSIAVDTDRIAQVLNNLVANALRYTPSDGQVTLSAEPEGGNARALAVPAGGASSPIAHRPSPIVLRVRDTGSGIAAEDLPFVFDRFYRADKARQRTDSTSSGLGLAIARAIVEAHGGTIAVASAPGQGTTFTITLPVASWQADGEREARGRGRH